MNNEQVLRAFMQKVWNEKDFNSIPDFVASAYRIYLDNADPWEGKTLTHDDFKARMNYSFHAFPDMYFEIKTAIYDGNQVAITWIMTGTNIGSIGEFPPTYKTIRTTGMTIYHFKDGKICGHSQVFDRTAVMMQLGYLE